LPQLCFSQLAISCDSVYWAYQIWKDCPNMQKYPNHMPNQPVLNRRSINCNLARSDQSSLVYLYLGSFELAVSANHVAYRLNFKRSHLNIVNSDFEVVICCSCLSSNLRMTICGLLNWKLRDLGFKVALKQINKFPTSCSDFDVLQSLSFPNFCLDSYLVTVSFFHAAFYDEAKGSSK